MQLISVNAEEIKSKCRDIYNTHLLDDFFSETFLLLVRDFEKKRHSAHNVTTVEDVVSLFLHRYKCVTYAHARKEKQERKNIHIYITNVRNSCNANNK